MFKDVFSKVICVAFKAFHIWCPGWKWRTWQVWSDQKIMPIWQSLKIKLSKQKMYYWIWLITVLRVVKVLTLHIFHCFRYIIICKNHCKNYKFIVVVSVVCVWIVVDMVVVKVDLVDVMIVGKGVESLTGCVMFAKSFSQLLLNLSRNFALNAKKVHWSIIYVQDSCASLKIKKEII